LAALRDQGLVTGAEYSARRRANIGALLPLTAPPPAAGLDRDVPTTEQISARLRAIGRALEMRAISVQQQAAERSIILDALMPEAPVAVANPGAPPRGLMQAADAVRRLEQLRDSGFISSEEYSRERQAIEIAMQPQGVSPATNGGQAMDKAKTAPAQMSGPSPALHLASYRSIKKAERGWAQLRRAHSAILGDMGHTVTKVDLAKKGTYYRLKAGPVASAEEAGKVCGLLKRRRQYCQPSVMSGG
jgi:hypothetical protein